MTTETYLQIKRRHEIEMNALPIQWAFSRQQFEEGMRALDLEPHETDQVCKIPGGGFMRKTDANLLDALLKTTVDADMAAGQVLTYEERAARNRALDAFKALDIYRNNPRTLDLNITMDGGLIQDIITDDPGLIGQTVTVIDYDTDGAPDCDLEFVDQGNGKAVAAYVSTFPVIEAEIPIYK
jgi:hypothetical protein